MSYIVRKNEVEQQQREDQFEQYLFINNPDMYHAYQEQKNAQIEENAGLQKIEWRSPQSFEEAKAVADEFADFYEQIKDDLEKETKQITNTKPQQEPLSLLSEEDLKHLQE